MKKPNKTIHTPRHHQLIALLKHYKKKNNLTQTHLATQLNKPQSYISKILSGERRLDVIEWLDLCNALNVKPQKLLKKLLKHQEHIT